MLKNHFPVLFFIVCSLSACGSGGGGKNSVSTPTNNEVLTPPVLPPKVVSVEAMATNTFSFAALLNDGSVVTWGEPKWGGDSSSVRNKLKGVQKIYASKGAFAALKDDGSLVVWGNPTSGGDATNIQEDLYNIVEVFPRYGGFSALRKDSVLINWGSPVYPAEKAPKMENVSNVISSVESTFISVIFKDRSVVVLDPIATEGKYRTYESYPSLSSDLVKGVANEMALFAGVLSSGEVVSWGDAGRTTNFQAEKAKGTKNIYPAGWGFLATFLDKTTYYWGLDPGEENGTPPPLGLNNVTELHSVKGEAIALLENGSVASWGYHGDRNFSGSDWEIYNDFPKTLTNIEHIYAGPRPSGSGATFAAVDKFSNAYSWGASTSPPKQPVTNVDRLILSDGGIAAIKFDGSVEYWGRVYVEIDTKTLKPIIDPLLVNVKQIYATNYAFAAIRKDGSVVTWGDYVPDGVIDLSKL
ncbi:MAG: hypothetical protein U1F46_09255 [Marinagarivorans sp.]